MSRPLTALGLILALAACDDANPFQNNGVVAPVDPDPAPVIDPDNPVSPNGIPEALTNGNLNAVQYDPAGGGTLLVDMNALDRNDNDIPLEEFTPNANLTPLAPGYQVFSYQDDALDRLFVAIVAQDPTGSVVGAVVMDGGQFTKFFGGGFYATDGDYTPGVGSNDTGLVSYAGKYAGLSNLDADGAELLQPQVPVDPSIRPSQPAQISGDIFINADFGDNKINGGIYNRAFQNLSPAFAGVSLEDVFLIPADITDAGTFFGDVENSAQDGIGSYGGTFGGTEAAGVAGVLNLDGDSIQNIDNEAEFGVFVLTQCGQPGEAAICDNVPVNPQP